MVNDDGAQRYGVELDVEKGRFNKEMDDANAKFDKLGRTAINQGKAVDSSFGKVTNSVRQMTQSITSGITSMMAGMVGFSAAMKGGQILTQMASDAKAFAKAMLEVATISQEVKENMADWKDQVLDMTTKVPIGAEEAAKALYQINSAGQSGANAMKVLEVSAKAAIGGVTDTATSADAITTLLNAYKMSADDAEAVSDKLFMTVKLGKTTMAELGHSISGVASTAATFGVSLDEVLGAIATMTKQGVPTSQAINQLNAAILATSQALGDGAFKGRSLAEAFGEIVKMSDGSTNAMKEELGRVGALSAVLQVTGKNAEMAANDLSQIKNAAGAASEAFETMAQSGGNQITLLRNNIAKELQPMFDSMSKTTKEMASSLNALFESGEIRSYISALVTLIEMYGAYKAIVILATIANKGYKLGLAELQRAQMFHTMAMRAEGKAITELTLKQKLLTALTHRLGQAWSVLSKAVMANPYVALAGAIAVAGVALYKLSQNADVATQKMNDLADVNKKVKEQTADEIAKINLLIKAIKDQNTSNDTRIAKVKELNGIIGDEVFQLDREGKIIKENTALVDNYTESLKKNARARIVQDKVMEIEKEIIDLEETRNKYKENSENLKVDNGYAQSAKQNLDKEIKEIDKKIDERNQRINALYEVANSKKDTEMAIYNPESSGSTKKETIKNKKYWEDEQKKWQAEMDKYEVGTKAYTEARKKYLEATKKLNEGYGSHTGNNKAVEQEAERAQKEADLINEQTKQRVRLAKDTEFAIRQAEIEQRDETTQKKLKQIRLDYDKQMEEIKRGREDLVAEKESEARQLWEAQNKDKTKTWQNTGRWKSGAFALTDDEKKQFEEQEKAALAVRQRAEYEATKDSYAAMNEYLKQFGTLEQKRMAISAEYDRKIFEEREEWRKRTLEAEKEAALAEFDFNAFKNSVDWQTIFGDLQIQSTDILKRSQAELQKMLENKNLTIEQYKDLSEQLAKVSDQIVRNENVWLQMFGSIGEALIKRKKQTIEVANATKALADAEKAVAQSRSEVEETMRLLTTKLSANNVMRRQVTLENSEDIKTDVAEVFGTDSDFYKEIERLIEALQKQSKTQEENEGKADQAKNWLSMAKNSKGNGANVAAITDAIIHGINQNMQSLAKTAESFDIDKNSTFAKATQSFAESSQYATAAFEALKNGDFVGIANNLNQAFGSLGETLGSLGLSGFGSSDKTYTEDMELLTESNNALRNSIEKLRDDLDNSSFADADKIYEKQMSNATQYGKNLQEQLLRSGGAYSNGFLGIGGKKSSNNKINNGLTAADWSAVSRAAGRSVTSASQFWTLTSEQMSNVAKYASTQYAKIKQYADDGFKDASQYMDEYIEQWEQLRDIEDAYNQKLTSTSFDDVKSQFRSTLSDMEKDASDFADDFESMLQQAVIGFMMDETYNKQLEDWYKDFAEKMKGGLTASERELLKASYNDIVNSAVEERNEIRDAMGWDDTTMSNAKSRGFNAMSQDTGNEMNGRLTAIQINVEMLALGQQKSFNLQTENNLLLQTCSNTLQTIARHTASLPIIEEDIADIRSKIQNL